MAKPRAIFGGQKTHVDFRPFPSGQIRRVPPLGALLEIEVAAEPAKHTEQAAIQE
jgi:hypothetical protein